MFDKLRFPLDYYGKLKMTMHNLALKILIPSTLVIAFFWQLSNVEAAPNYVGVSLYE